MVHLAWGHFPKVRNRGAADGDTAKRISHSIEDRVESAVSSDFWEESKEVLFLEDAPIAPTSISSNSLVN